MAPLLMAYLAVSVLTAGSNPQLVRDEWRVFTNAKYGYEIRYPGEFEGFATGPEGQRDGASIRIARREYAAPAPVLDIHLAVNYRALPSDAPPDMYIVRTPISIDGNPALQVEYRWKSNQEIAFVEISHSTVVFVFQAGAGVDDFRSTIWANIVQAFRYLNK